MIQSASSSPNAPTSEGLEMSAKACAILVDNQQTDSCSSKLNVNNNNMQQDLGDQAASSSSSAAAASAAAAASNNQSPLLSSRNPPPDGSSFRQISLGQRLAE